MIGQWGALIAPCSTNPQQWDTMRTVDGREKRAPAADLQAALYTCRTSCPLLDTCLQQEPSPNSVHAGTIYDDRGKPFRTVDRFLRVAKKTKSTGCGEKVGTNPGWRLHEALKEAPCDECRRARNAAKRAWKKKACAGGHPYTNETTVINKAGHRTCLLCKPGAVGTPLDAPKPRYDPKHKLMACRRMGHDWSVPKNVDTDRNGNRKCAECRRIDDRAKSAARIAARAAA